MDIDTAIEKGHTHIAKNLKHGRSIFVTYNPKTGAYEDGYMCQLANVEENWKLTPIKKDKVNKADYK